MKGLLYLPEVGPVADQVKESVEAGIPEEKLEVYHSIDRLYQRFREPLDDLGVAVLMAANHEELKNISSIQHLLRGLRIILVIPDQKEETVALAHQLRPRFLTYINGDLSTITAVVARMFKAK